MSAKYHINPETGRPNKCVAKEGNCKYRSEDGTETPHYATKEEAREAYEKLKEQKSEHLEPLKKTVSNNTNNADELRSRLDTLDEERHHLKSFAALPENRKEMKEAEKRVREIEAEMRALREKFDSGEDTLEVKESRERITVYENEIQKVETELSKDMPKDANVHVYMNEVEMLEEKLSGLNDALDKEHKKLRELKNILSNTEESSNTAISSGGGTVNDGAKKETVEQLGVINELQGEGTVVGGDDYVKPEKPKKLQTPRYDKTKEYPINQKTLARTVASTKHEGTIEIALERGDAVVLRELSKNGNLNAEQLSRALKRTEDDWTRNNIRNHPNYFDPDDERSFTGAKVLKALKEDPYSLSGYIDGKANDSQARFILEKGWKSSPLAPQILSTKNKEVSLQTRVAALKKGSNRTLSENVVKNLDSDIVHLVPYMTESQRSDVIDHTGDDEVLKKVGLESKSYENKVRVYSLVTDSEYRERLAGADKKLSGVHNVSEQLRKDNMNIMDFVSDVQYDGDNPSSVQLNKDYVSRNGFDIESVVNYVSDYLDLNVPNGSYDSDTGMIQ